jgi:phage/plasmid primase-like uncharacterized protein
MTATSVPSPEKPLGDRIGQLKATQPLIQDFIPGLKRKSDKEYCGPCPHCKDGEDRFIVFTETQTYWCRQCNAKGDILSYITLTTGKSVKEQLAEAGLLDNPSPARKRGSKQQFIWRKSKSGDSPAYQYFSETRGITDFQHSPAIRWNSFKNKNGGELINRIALRLSKPGDNLDDPASLHYLFIDTSANPLRKTGSQTSNAEDGAMKGRAVWFYPDKDTKIVAVAEGAETTLSALSVLNLNGAAALTVSGLKGIVLPQDTKELLIFCDQDTADKGCAGQKAALELAKRFEKNGGTAWIVSPSDQCFAEKPEKLDFNDLLQKDPSGWLIRERFKKKQRLDEIGWRPQEQGQRKEAKPRTKESWLSAEAQEELRKLNAEYAVVLMGGKLRIIQEGHDDLFDKSTVDFLDKDAFLGFYKNKKVLVPTGKDDGMKKVDIGNLWMNWEERRSFKKVVFDPSRKCSDDAYNLFRGFSFKPKKGDWSKMKNHIMEVICGGNEKYYDYFIQWMARMVQDPGGKRPGVTIVMKGKKGTGKSLVSEYFGSLFGDAYLPVANQHHIPGNFNMHLSKCLFLFLDEAIWGGDKKAEGILKHLITSDVNMFEPKGIDSVAMKSYLNIMIASNEDWVIPATADERRFFALDVKMDLQGKEKRDYFNAIYEEMQNGGPAAMLHDLLEVDVDLDVLRDPPKTDLLSEQVELGLPEEHKFWQEVISRKFLLSYNDTGRPYISEGCSDPSDGLWPDRAYKYEIYKEYENFCKRLNLKRYSNETWFWKRTWTIWPGGKPEGRLQGSGENRADMVELFHIGRMAEAFKEATGVRIDLDDDCPLPF